jgi:hypothetical protein
VGEISFSAEEFPAYFLFKFLDSPGEGWGGNMTLLGRTPKVQIFA